MKLLRVLSPKDLDEINVFLGELKDGDKYQKRLEALEDQKKEINALIEVYGDASDIDRIRSNALRDEDQAKKTLEKALAEKKVIDDTIAGAVTESEAMLVAKSREATKLFAERERVLIDGEEALGMREKDHLRSLDNLTAREADVTRDIESAMAIRTQYTEAVASLKTAIEKTAKAL